MQTSTLRLRSIAWGHRLMPATVVLGLLLVSGFAQSGFAQSANGPLNFGNNFFVTGDYVVAGAQGMNTNFASDGTTTGTITIPDANPGIQPGPTSTCIINGIPKTNCVPAGAEILSALLYWQTVEKVGQPGTGQNGFFRPVFNGGPKTGYPIAGEALQSHSSVSFSFGGCSGTSTGKVVQTYRANVRGYLRQDASGNFLANGTYEVRLPSVGPTTPLTLGATLVIIYRVLSPDVPLNSIVIYDGGFADNTSLNMMQTVQGFYEAAQNPVSRLTHIVGGGKNNKFQDVYLNNIKLPHLYGSGQPFPGYYGGATGYGWDNTTWTFGPNSNPPGVVPGTASATTMVVPASSQGGCVSWGAVIVSTTVQNTDNDGLLDVWKAPPNSPNRPGYCDASVSEGVCNPGDPSWTDLPGAVLGMPGNTHPDVFVQLDYMCTTVTGLGACDTNLANVTSYSITSNVITVIANNSFHVGETVQLRIPSVSYLNSVTFAVLTVSPTQSPTQFTAAFTHADVPPTAVMGTAYCCSFDPRLTFDPDDGRTAVQKVVDAFADRDANGNRLNLHQPVNLHVFPTHAIKEETCQDIHVQGGLLLCPFPNQPGVVWWKAGLIFLKNQFVDPGDQVCTTSPPAANCVLRFEHKKKDSWHDSVWAHALALPNWTLQAGTLTSVVQSGHTVTFTTSTPHKLGVNANDPSCAQDRVTVAFAITNPSLNATFCVQVIGPPATSTAFTIQVANSTSATYTFSTDPNLAVAPGHAGTISGFSDIGGQDSLIALGNWKPEHQTAKVKAGTFMHELGHNEALAHGAITHTDPHNPYVPTVDANCAPNYQSVMNYLFQVDLLDNGSGVNVPDYSGQVLDTLNESSSYSLQIPPVSPFSILTNYLSTSWYVPFSGVGTPATVHCDGTPLLNTDHSMTRRTDLTSLLSWSMNQDINFDGNTSESLHGHNDWTGTATSPAYDGRQISAAGSLSAHGAGGPLGGGGGAGGPLGGGGGAGGPFGGGGGAGGPLGGGGGAGGPLGGGGGAGGPLGGGGGKGGPLGGGGGELDQTTADSVTRSPRHLMASEGASPRTITLTWMQPTFSVIGAYRIYRSSDGGVTFALVPNGNNGAVPGNQLTYTDTVTCNHTGYQYYVSAVLAGTFAMFPPQPAEGQESVPSNTVSTIPPSTDLLTGCYTLTGFSSPASAVHGSLVPIIWTLTDDFYTAGNPVTNKAANTLVAIGPVPNSCATATPTRILLNGTPQSGASTFTPSGTGQFTFNWDTDGFCAGSYTFQLTLDSGQTQTTTSALQLQIDVNDTDTPHITTTTLTAGTVGSAYPQYVLTQHGGTPPLTWNFSGATPAGMMGSSTGILSGTPCMAGSFSFMVTVTDSKSNSGTLGLNLLINKANTTTSVSSNANPAVYGQIIPFTVTVAPNSPCIPTGTVTLLSDRTPIAFNSLNGGTAMFMTSLPVGTHSITATYGGDGNFIGSTSSSFSQTVNMANTTTSVSSSLDPSVFGQAVTFTAAVVPVLPGMGAPTGMVNFFDGGTPIGSGTVTGGAASLTTSALAVGTRNITASYGGDSNFFGSTSASFSQTVTPAPLTASVTGSESGGPPPTTFTVASVSYSGFVNGDTSSVVTGTLTCSVSATADAVGNYPISCSGLTASNYSISYSYSVGPSARRTVLATDPAGNVLLFGGSDGTNNLADTWVWNGTTWVQQVPATSPPGRNLNEMVLDPSLNKVVLFGGAGAVGYNDTWTWDGTTWTQVSPTGGPPSQRYAFGMDYDGAANAIVIFGGYTANGPAINDTWELAGLVNSALTYTQLQPLTPPNPLCCAAMAFDPISSSTLLFGGTRPDLGYGQVSDTWQFQSGRWTQLTSLGNYPPARSGTAMVYDPVTSTIVLFGGTSASGDLNDTWIWDGKTSTWTQAIANGVTGSPPARRFDAQGMAYDTITKTVVMFGGFAHNTVTGTDTPLGDTWIWNGSNWVQQTGPLTVTVNGTQPVGGTPTFTATYSGFVNGDTLSVVTGTLSCTTSATTSSLPGPYPILSCSGLSAPNTYSITYALGTVSVQ